MTAREVLDGAAVQTALALGHVAFPETPEERDKADAQITGTVARLTAALEAVLTLHKPADPSPSRPWVSCDGCTNGCPYPCPTVTAIETALTT